MGKNKLIISGTGCALADYLYTDISFNSPAFRKYLSRQPGDGGLSPGKLVFTEEIEKFAGIPFPEILRELTGNKAPDAVNIGGPGLVSMIHASQLLVGGEFVVSFYGGTGDDETARFIYDHARKTPLDISNYKRISDKATPFTDVLSDPTYDQGQGERIFINNIGAAWDFHPALLKKDFFQSHVVCFGGTALVPQLHDNLTILLMEAKNNDCLTVVNTVYDFRNEKQHPGAPWPLGDPRESLRQIDLLIMDREEALKISGKESMDQAAEFFIEHGVSSFIITNGAKDLYAFSDGSVFQKTQLSKFPVSEKIKDELEKSPGIKKDTTGCGDNFAGGAIASLARQLKTSVPGKLNFIDLIAWAVGSGGFSCFHLGGTYFEKAPGEKLSKIEAYKNEYIKQIS